MLCCLWNWKRALTENIRKIRWGIDEDDSEIDISRTCATTRRSLCICFCLCFELWQLKLTTHRLTYLADSLTWNRKCFVTWCGGHDVNSKSKIWRKSHRGTSKACPIFLTGMRIFIKIFIWYEGAFNEQLFWFLTSKLNTYTHKKYQFFLPPFYKLKAGRKSIGKLVFDLKLILFRLQ